MKKTQRSCVLCTHNGFYAMVRYVGWQWVENIVYTLHVIFQELRY